MSRSLTIRKTFVYACFLGCLLSTTLGLTCTEGGDLDPSVPAGNRPPRVIITDVSSPSGDNFAQQGDVVTISFTADDGEDQAIVRVFASLSTNPTVSEEIPIMTGYLVGPGAGSGAASWDTTPVVAGSYNIFAEISDGTYNEILGTGNPPVRVTAGSPLTIAQPGTAPENGAPTISIELPTTDAGLSNKDVLTVRYRVKDPNSDEDPITVTILLDKDKDTSNDATQPPLVVATDVVPAGTMDPDEYNDPARQAEIEIDLNDVPIRIQTDEAGRPLPYYVRIQATDGQNVVNKYAVGAVRVLAAPSDVVDLLQIGSTAAGATWQGFDGFPDDPDYGSRAGSAFAALGDMDGDGIDDFAIAAQTASPFNEFRVGETYLVYGRDRRVDPDAADFRYAQGRYAGVMNVNTIGSFVPFPVTDPRHETVFNIRGTILPHPAVNHAGSGSMGIESIVAMPDITGDSHPELLVGSPYNDTVTDREDNDPCDECIDDDATPLIAFTDQTSGEIASGESIEFPSVIAGGVYTYPVTSAYQNAQVDLSDGRVQRLDTLRIVLSGQRLDGLGQAFGVDVKLEGANGPVVSQTIIVDGDGKFDDVAIEFVAPATPTGLPVDLGDPIPPSTYDGYFSVHVRPDVAIQSFKADLTMIGTSRASEEYEKRRVYADGYPDPLSDEPGSDSEIPPVNPLALDDLEPVCPPRNRSYRSEIFRQRGEYGLVTFGNQEGHTSQELGGVFTSCSGGVENDDLSSTAYQSGLVFVCGSDDMVLPLNEDHYWTRAGLRVANLGLFGQPTSYRRGARFRGAWYQPLREYDPFSLFGYTVDVMPDISTFWGDTELLVSSPGSGRYSVEGPVDMGANLNGVYDHAGVNPVRRSGSFDMGTLFNRVLSASLVIDCYAERVPRLRVGLDGGTGVPIPEFSRVALLWDGASPPPEPDQDPTISNDSFFGAGLQLQQLRINLPQAALPYLLNGTGTIAVELLDDCAVTDSYVEILSAEIEVTGLLRDTGLVTIMDSDDYTSNRDVFWCGAPETDGDQESDDDRPMSWPSYDCGGWGGRWGCQPPVFTTLEGEKMGDAFGFARHSGDLNLDGVADIACGAPGSDCDPNNPDIHCGPEAAPLQNNGKVYVIYGTPTLGDSDGRSRPCEFERFEIRGTHDEDQFGRVQGRAGDLDGDGNDDFFFAAEGYDAVGALGGLPVVGADAGFVGVLFGRSYGQATISIKPEQVGTEAYPGCKFVGGSAGARLGGGTPAHTTRVASERGQHGVSSAGDFNLDGYEDLLITAPGQVWPGAYIVFTGDVPAGSKVKVNNNQFTFPKAMSASEAQQYLVDEMGRMSAETLGVSAITSRLEFPEPLPDNPTISFLARRPSAFSVTTTAANVTISFFERLGVAYLIFGDETLLTNKTWVLPDDLNRRDVYNNRVLKGAVFVSAYEKNNGASDSTPDEAPIEVVSVVGDVDNDGFVDLMLGAPQADFINILAPGQRRQATGEAYLIYGNEYGLNEGSEP